MTKRQKTTYFKLLKAYMQKTKYIFTLLLLCACAFAYAAKFKVSVEVCVGLRTEDKFYFEMDEGEIQQKGYDGKMLAKRYRGHGFPHRTIKFQESEEEIEKQKAEIAKRTPAEEADAKLFELNRKIREFDRRIESAKSMSDSIVQKRDILAKIIEKDGKNPRALKKSFDDFLEKYEKKEATDENYERLMRRIPRDTGDVEEIDVGSYFDIKILKAFEKGVTADVNMSYSRINSWFYSDGNNNDNTITKQPIYEKFEKLDVKELPLEFGKSYCFQFGRPDQKTARSLKEAESRTQLFGESRETLKVEETAEAPAQTSPLDAQGPLSEIKKKFKSDEGKTIRFIIKVTKIS